MLEFDHIARIRARCTTRSDVLLGIGDDAALLQVPANTQLVVATDTLNAGVHFPEATSPADIGWKALAVNLSDLAAMGATPAWCTLSLSMPEADAAWVDAFLDGFLELADAHRVALVGGDTTRGPLSVCVTAHGFVEAGSALLRSGARVGDEIWTSGTLGDAAGALVQLQAGSAVDPALRERLDRPTPRVALGRALRGIAGACIDISDGLLADLGHVCSASGLGAEIELAALPASAALRSAFDEESRRSLQATGGDDYELCFTAPETMRSDVERAAREAGVEVARVGRIVAGTGVVARRENGEPWTPPRRGYAHFA
ncbi:thiamine-phosphate kinase [Pseudoluteimonas lycopersici]|uniref:Thiamine-monophosphate kinase n=1 Tax=Pseudoluteimonas lycopersici TaxID=1324796 RepID=A0A516V7I7_9GAMM|nr:thiamine-phosphate kinase [Lysobacter lycopersici]QDQ74485.1 thiamine-phosphate kinase [Lysobacter lycopersici]